MALVRLWRLCYMRLLALRRVQLLRVQLLSRRVIQNRPNRQGAGRDPSTNQTSVRIALCSFNLFRPFLPAARRIS